MVVLPFSSSFLGGGVNIHQTLQDFRTSPSQRGEKLVINLVTGSHWQSDTSPFWTGVDNPVFMFNLNFQAGLFQRNVCNDLLPIIISLSFFYFKKHLLTKHPPSRHQTSTSNHPKKNISPGLRCICSPVSCPHSDSRAFLPGRPSLGFVRKMTENTVVS